jgi:hypothetical protein
LQKAKRERGWLSEPPNKEFGWHSELLPKETPSTILDTFKVAMSGLESDELAKLLPIINSGRAILFTGAGFSCECRNVNNEHPPLSKELANMIGQLGGFDAEGDLMYAADYYLKGKTKSDLLRLLKNCFTIKAVNRSHELISSLNWRRIYTTNYDNAIEFAAAQAGKALTPKNCDDNPRYCFRERDQVVHINGIAIRATEEYFDNQIRLSQSSYDSPESFAKSPWYYYFKQDLESCSAIVFAGYSLYDIDITRILFSKDKIFRAKTYFIAKENPSPKTAYRFESYGHMLPIGIDGFAKYIDANPGSVTALPDFFTTMDEYTIDNRPVTQYISDTDINKFIMQGDISDIFIASALTAPQVKPFIVIRESIAKICELIDQNRHCALISDLGNGKSILLRQITITLALYGKRVFTLHSPEGDFRTDIQKLHDMANECIVVIDDYASFPDVIKYILSFNSPYVKTIFADRTNKHDTYSKILRDTGTSFVEFGVNMLTDTEVDTFMLIVDNLGWWPKDIFSEERKKKFLKIDNNSQFSSSLLSIFDAPQIKDRLRGLITPLLRNPDYQSMIFSICLLEELGLPRSTTLISEIADNDAIWDAKVTDDPSFRQLFEIRHGKVASKSAILTHTLLTNFFKSFYIVSRLLDLAEKYDRIRDTGEIQYQIFLSLVRFSTVERMLPDEGKVNSLIRYYEDLKIRVPRQISNPMFWLQYGMARISHNQLSEAQAHISAAYRLADRRDYFDTSAIDTQQARIHLMVAIQSSDGRNAWEQFEKAHKILSALTDDKFKFRQLPLYLEFYEKKYELIPSKSKAGFAAAIRHTRSLIQKSTRFSQYSVEADASLWYARRCLDRIPL